jgi:hypothetical protein
MSDSPGGRRMSEPVAEPRPQPPTQDGGPVAACVGCRIAVPLTDSGTRTTRQDGPSA